MNKVINLVLIIGFTSFYNINAQNGFTTNNNELEELYERELIYSQNGKLFQDVKPYNLKDIHEAFNNEKTNSYVYNELSEFRNEDRPPNKKFLGLFYKYSESFLHVNTKDFQMRINPILELKAGKEKERDEFIYSAFRGAEIRGNIGGVLNFYTQFTENQYRPFQYIKNYGTGFNGQNTYNFNPYYTYWKDINANQGYDFNNALGYLEYNPSKYFSIMMGHDRNHYGYGYRSLFLGDNGAPYFQLKANAYVWKFHYQALFAQFTGQYIRSNDRLLPRKYGAFHLLTFKPSKKLDLGLFEGIIFNRNNGFELSYLNPVIFYRSVEHSLGSSDNAMMGFQAKYTINNHSQLYTQFLLDDIQVNQFLKSSGWWGNKYGIQLGAKFVDLFKIPNLDGKIEFNAVRPYTYSHFTNDGTDTLDNFSHYNQPLAHPYGANFMEVHSELQYRVNSKTKVTLKYNYSKRGVDSSGLLYGGNIFANTNANNIAAQFNNTIAQGSQVKTHFLMLSGQYSLFHNMFWDLDLFYRNSELSSVGVKQNQFGFSTGLRINLRKRDYLF